MSHLVAGVGFEPHDLRVSWCIAPKHWLKPKPVPFRLATFPATHYFNSESRLTDNKERNPKPYPTAEQKEKHQPFG